MASWREIERIRTDGKAVRSMAGRLLADHRAAMRDWEVDFLEGRLVREEVEELTTRQAEKLLEIRDSVVFVSQYRGFNLKRLLHDCHHARLDLDEEDEEWIVERHAEGSGTIRYGHVGRLMRCARQLGLIDEPDQQA